jgi:predicted amidohydrolase
MKEQVRASLVQFASEWLQPQKNAERIQAFVEAEAREGQELIVFPELVNTGYITPVEVGVACGYPDLSYADFAQAYVKAAETIPGPTTEAVAAVTRRYGAYAVVGMAQRHPVIPCSLYNSAVLIGPRGVVGVTHKSHIPLNEKQFFYPGDAPIVYQTELGAIGMQVCYDGRFPETTRLLALRGAEIVCSLWCVPAIFTVPDAENSLRYRTYTRAQENGVYFLSCNRSGWEGKTQMLGHSVVSAPDGSFVAMSTSTNEEVVRAELTDQRLRKYRSTLSIFRDRRPDLYGELCRPLSEPFRMMPALPADAPDPAVSGSGR